MSDPTIEERRDEHGRPLCRSLTKRGNPCGGQARRGGFCVEHQDGNELLHLGVSRKQQALARQAETVKMLLGDDGLTLSQIRSSLTDYPSKLARDELVEMLRRDPDVTESSERRPDAAGRERAQIVLRICR